jgi:hypothetical protein
LEDAIRDGAKRIITARPSERGELLAACEHHLAGMRTLNADHFGSSPSISSIIDELQIALHALAASESPHFDIIWPALSRLESNVGFGTYAI